MTTERNAPPDEADQTHRSLNPGIVATGFAFEWLIVFGIVIGVIGLLSVFSLIITDAIHLVPLTRIPGYLWIMLAGFKLPGNEIADTR